LPSEGSIPKLFVAGARQQIKVKLELKIIATNSKIAIMTITQKLKDCRSSRPITTDLSPLASCAF